MDQRSDLQSCVLIALSLRAVEAVKPWCLGFSRTGSRVLPQFSHNEKGNFQQLPSLIPPSPPSAAFQTLIVSSVLKDGTSYMGKAVAISKRKSAHHLFKKWKTQHGSNKKRFFCLEKARIEPGTYMLVKNVLCHQAIAPQPVFLCKNKIDLLSITVYTTKAEPTTI